MNSAVSSSTCLPAAAVCASQIEAPRVEVGHPAPLFKSVAVVDGRLKEVSLSAYTEASHWLILIFFPKAWSFICPTEIKAFSARLEEFLYSRMCAVAFVSTDSDHCLKAWNNTSDMEGGLGGVHVPLISDCNHQISKDYGVLNSSEGISQRALFMIDPKGIVRGITINDTDVGRSVDETLRVLDALIFKEEFGEGCPVDWEKGDKGIDIGAKNRIEGPVELGVKKSWSDWARPKLNRAWSATSGRSVSQNLVHTLNSNRMRSESNDRMSAGHRPAMSSGQQSPMVSPTSNDGMEMEALMQQRMENLAAAMQNGQSSIGVAN